MSGKKYNITYSNGALQVIDDMTRQYGFEGREETLNFALFVIKKLKENGNVSLKERYGRN